MSMKLVILGLLMEANRHTYEIRQTMKERGMNNYMKLQDGSLYYAMDQLHKDELVEAHEVVRDTNRPEKTIYQITAAGKLKFQELLVEQLHEEIKHYHPLYVALPFSVHGDQAKIADILENKILAQKIIMNKMKSLYEEHISIVPRVVLQMLIGTYKRAFSELKWLEQLQKDAREGRLQEKNSPLEVDWDRIE
ncbi:MULTISPECIES: PadR family transcriptional regulator [unclassified Paenibacillus]|uniref:PadR family transcriptional regulator n=1 Tax=unclassified Paenibacillus TaxID=185978 RepID=UPI00277DC870|nr:MULTISPECIES: helix-turn-helix transcriptional regulator [unclassified Paenibacillus]MDQ0901603.1 DNA-binding PadR family transcriptional regulator [Paenibacillus sp. V4I7]MDQ0919896.1 DNA-binding PadR family transcriptional regulator [Paenibacillus sp. V4I5]